MVAWISKHQVENTKKTYSTYARKYKVFCEERKLPLEDPAVISQFLREGMEKQNLSASTLNDVVACSISDIFRMDKVKPTHDPLVRETKKVIARLAKKGPGGKTPLPLKMLEEFVQNVNPHRTNDIRDILLFIIMFGGLLRESEAVAKYGRVGSGRKLIHFRREIQNGSNPHRLHSGAGGIDHLQSLPNLVVQHIQKRAREAPGGIPLPQHLLPRTKAISKTAKLSAERMAKKDWRE